MSSVFTRFSPDNSVRLRHKQFAARTGVFPRGLRTMDKSVMTGPMMIDTARLRLVAITPELARDQVEDPAAFFAALGVDPEPAWPPELATHELLSRMSAELAGRPECTGWYQWVYVLPVLNRLVGMGGFQGEPSADGEIEIGYTMLTSYREQGLATEGVEALLDWAYEHDSVRAVIARTSPDRVAARRVLEKVGFTQSGPGSSSSEIIEFRHVRAAAAA
jgi:ribosomal-protein-alanine N-acetyltransferase